MGLNIFSNEDRHKFLYQVFFDLFTLLPNDRCIYTENNILEFNPNVCNIKKEECPKCIIPKPVEVKCPECKNTECDCPVCLEQPKPETEILNMWTMILIIIIIILVALYLTKEGNVNIKNLSKL